MSECAIYLTVGREKRQPENDGYIAIISEGQPQLGDEVCTILSVKLVHNMKAARKWYREMKQQKPWETRQ